MKNLKDYQIIIVGLLIAVGAILSTSILANAVVEFQKLQNQTIRVTGSASQNIISDFASLTIRFTARATDLKSGYAKMDNDAKNIKEFLISNGLEEDKIIISPIYNYEYYKRVGAYTSNEIEGYNVSCNIKVSSSDVAKITNVSKKINELVNKNINISSSDVQYFVSNIDDLKIKMVGEATKNARERAESMVAGTKGKIGSMNSAKMGVFQIVPVNSTDVSDYGINDTSSIEKKIVSTVNVTFNVK